MQLLTWIADERARTGVTLTAQLASECEAERAWLSFRIGGTEQAFGLGESVTQQHGHGFADI